MIQTIMPNAVGEHDTILDVRRHVGADQIRGALRYEPKHLFAAKRLTLPLNVEGRIVLNADSERDAAEIAGRLESMGARDVRLLSGGIDAWRDAGGAVEEPTQEQPIPEVPSAGLRDL